MSVRSDDTNLTKKWYPVVDDITGATESTQSCSNTSTKRTIGVPWCKLCWLTQSNPQRVNWWFHGHDPWPWSSCQIDNRWQGWGLPSWWSWWIIHQKTRYTPDCDDSAVVSVDQRDSTFIVCTDGSDECLTTGTARHNLSLVGEGVDTSPQKWSAVNGKAGPTFKWHLWGFGLAIGWPTAWLSPQQP